MTERAKHTKAWEDDHMAGVDCHVKTVRRQSGTSGRIVDAPTDGGTVNAGEEAVCASCGARLRLRWDVRLETISEVEAR